MSCKQWAPHLLPAEENRVTVLARKQARTLTALDAPVHAISDRMGIRQASPHCGV